MASIAAIACNGVARLSTTGLRRVTSASAGVVNRRRGRSGQGRGHHCADARTICRSSLISAGRRSSMPAVAACALNGVSPTCRFICTSVGPSAQFAMVSRTRAPPGDAPIGQHATHGTSQPFGLGCVSPAAGEYGDIREFPRVRWLGCTYDEATAFRFHLLGFRLWPDCGQCPKLVWPTRTRTGPKVPCQMWAVSPPGKFG
ncbi:hypothetical protein F6W99_02719 [Mycobacterium tuberculosis]|nr:hypothetical protein F6W99_02719 [Mycobacterium tuberculosis]